MGPGSSVIKKRINFPLPAPKFPIDIARTSAAG